MVGSLSMNTEREMGRGHLAAMSQAEPRHTYVWSAMTKCHRLVALNIGIQPLTVLKVRKPSQGLKRAGSRCSKGEPGPRLSSKFLRRPTPLGLQRFLSLLGLHLPATCSSCPRLGTGHWIWKAPEI